MTATTFLHSLANKALGVLTQDVEPALLNLFKTFSEQFLTKIAPIAATELANVEGAAITAATSGNWEDFGALVGIATAATIKQAVSIAEVTSVEDAVAAVNTGVVAVNAAIAAHAGVQAAIATGVAATAPAAPTA